MRLNALRMLNFRQHADTVVEFDAGITGIIGANGSGKTTILEAIAWALYGNPAARGTRDSIRHNRAGPRASVRVELDFELAGHRYRVVRGLTSAELFLDGAEQPIANSISAVSDLLQRRLGMTREEFFNTYFTGQKELNVMAAMGPTQRAQFLSRVLGYEKLRSAQGLTRNRRKLLGAEIQGLAGGMPDPETVQRALEESRARVQAALNREGDARERRERAERALAEETPRWRAAEEARQRHQELGAELRVVESELAGLRRDEARVAVELQEADAARSRHDALRTELAELPALREEARALDALARDEGRRQALARNETELQEDLERLRERLAKLESAPALERDAQGQLATVRTALEQAERTAEERRTAWVRDRQEAETRRDALLKQWRELKEQRDQLAELGPESPCPTCTRPLGQSFETVLELLDEQLDTVRVDGGYFKDRLHQLHDQPDALREADEARRTHAAEAQALERRLAKIQAGLQELEQARKDVDARARRLEETRRELAALPAGYDAARHRRVRDQLDRLAPREGEAQRLAALLERAPRLHEERTRLAARLAELDARAADARARQAALGADEQRFAELRAAFERAQATARAAELELVQATGEVAAARATRAAAERDDEALRRVQQRVDALQGDRRLHDELDRAFTDLRTDLNFQLRPELSEIASAFLTELTDARYSELELDDQYNIVVLEDGIPKPVISGGEEDLANLVLRLAISQLIAERAGQSFSLLVLDEVFGSLDESRRLNVVELLRRLQDRFEQIILITHIESVREGVDRVVEVSFDAEAGTSRVRRRDADDAPDLLDAVAAPDDVGLGVAGYADAEALGA